MLRNMLAIHVNSEMFRKFVRTKGFSNLTSFLVLKIESSPIRTFKLNDKSVLAHVEIRKSLLRSLMLGVDCKVEKIIIVYSLLERLPHTLSNLQSLVHLEITNAQIQAVNLNAIGRLPKLEFLNLSKNMIHFLYYTEGIELFPGLLFFYLDGNQLQRINLNLFNKMRSLTAINLNGNQLSSISGAIVSNLVRTIELANNQLSWMDCCQWSLPHLHSLAIENNKLEMLPRCFERVFRNTSMIMLANNRLHFDEMEKFSLFSNMFNLDLSQNMLTHVTLTEKTLPPRLTSLNLSKNRLQRIEIPYSPNKYFSINLIDNCIKNFELGKVSPDLFQLLMYNNPIDCTFRGDVDADYDANLSNVRCIRNKACC
ncbi:leucine-rich repeat-containing protein let-4-like [Anopheles albimanus]|uniref:leucine-rich repeat-containing protein let-4-like n=1 Tax=Anopheles albimanus TaxID=7167 RepID=UPI0016407D6E|nr:leucine-rich repeat-containing protein let-4-like [Anopheles albimanus]